MRFSIIVPVYNVENYLPKCVESVLRQTFKDYEVILVDDGSTDHSGKLCDGYACRDMRFRVLHQRNHGLSQARNAGLEAAKGEWIAFVDSDDWIEPEMLQVLDGEIEKNPADLYRFNMRKVNEKGKETERLLYCVENGGIFFETEQEKFEFYFHVFMQYKIGWEVCGGIYKRNLIKKKKMKFEKTQDIFAEDYLFTFRYMLCVNEVRWLCNIFYNYFQRHKSTMYSLNLSTVLPRLVQWGEWGYVYAKKERMYYFVRNYEQLYFMLMNFHIKYMLSELPVEEVIDYMQNQIGRKWHRNWMKKLRRTQKQWEEYMGKRIWL